MTEVELWCLWNTQGFIPGDGETKEAFEKRVTFCISLKSHLLNIPPLKIFTKELYQEEAENTPLKQQIDKALDLTERLFGITPSWVPIIFSNYKLLPWHGGSAWLFTYKEQTGAVLQLSLRLKKKFSLFNLYTLSEIAAHEMVHIGRIMEEKDLFEEIFAYQTSKNSWRQSMGALIESQSEVLLFTAIILLAVIGDIFSLIFWNHPWLVYLAPFALFASFLLAIFAGIRLTNRKKIWSKSLKNLKKLSLLFPAEHLHYRLTTSEIIAFSEMSKNEIEAYILYNKQQSFRWHFLSTLYCPSI